MNGHGLPPQGPLDIERQRIVFRKPVAVDDPDLKRFGKNARSKSLIACRTRRSSPGPSMLAAVWPVRSRIP